MLFPMKLHPHFSLLTPQALGNSLGSQLCPTEETLWMLVAVLPQPPQSKPLQTGIMRLQNPTLPHIVIV